MRKILFRGKRIDTGEWMEGYSFSFGNGTPYEETFILGYLDPRDTIFDVWRCAEKVDPETVGQFTGLHDKNGKKMFEGDIVKWQTIGLEYKIMTIEFYRGGYIAVPVDPELRRPIIRLGNEPEYCEVIGNIHDNPELLEGEFDG